MKGNHATVSPGEPFDFSRAMRRLCVDVCARMDQFAHIRMEQVAVAFAQARRRVTHGLQAKLTPMRFADGTLTTIRHNQQWTVQRLYDTNGREMLYILTFYLPRFQNHTFREKMITVFHELYHISPKFDGDLRRFGGRYHTHSHSQTEYDAEMDRLVSQYLKQRPPAELLWFLRRRFSSLQKHFGRVMGLQVPIPKLIPLPDSRTA